MPIFKTTVSVTVYFQAKNKTEARREINDATLAQIAQEITDGLWIGGNHTSTAVERVPPDAVAFELQAIGNDGDFFNLI
jgi:hypothetical protein